MSTRLKRKLGDLGVDTHSNKANESFCLIGTPLPPLEKAKDLGEFVPLWKQDVRDEQGRRRLHGAFTGGFSAGYFNTVGSKEGWTPSTFVSSRSDRAKQKAARPEDYMDEEDLQELKDSKVVIDRTDEMDLTGASNQSLLQESESDPLLKALATSLMPSPQESAGALILKKMGWRLGQGIGPRVSLRQRKLQDIQATTGRRVTLDEIKITEDDEEANKHTYPPRDTPILIVPRKDNSHGVGYRPGMGLNESLGVSGKNAASSGPNLSTGFGLGALNDAEDDDVDVYDGAHDSRNRTAYDHQEGDDDHSISIGRHVKQGPSMRPAPSQSFFNNGYPVLSGFVLSEQAVTEERWFPPPEIPKGWKADPRRIWSAENKENFQQPSTQPPHLPGAKWNSGISAEQRGSMLGEAQPTASRSVFEYLSQKDRERLQSISSNLTSGTPSSGDFGPSSLPGYPPAPVSIKIPHTEPHIAQAALRGFQPFTTDPAKQARYVGYLQSQTSLDSSSSSTLQIKPLPGQKTEEYNKELEDYAKAALIFKPISGAMAGRFTSAAVFETGPKIVEGLHQPSAVDPATKEAEEEAERQRKEEEDRRVSPKAHAARMGMYGPMTRETKPWMPVRLLCKRFGVKDPNPQPDEEVSASASTSMAAGGGGAAVAWQQATTAAGGNDVEPSFVPGSGEALQGQQGTGRRDLANIGLGEDDFQGRDILTYQRPSMDIFKAIFASDDEDSDEEESAEKEDEESPLPALPKLAEPSIGASLVAGEGKTKGGTQDEGPVDLNTFKPTFIPREGKHKEKSKDEGGKSSKEKKEKRKKEKKSVLVSFEVDEEVVADAAPGKDRPKKKRRKEKEKRGGGEEKAAGKEADDSMRVEKLPPEAVKGTVSDSSRPVPDHQIVGEPVREAPSRSRKRAVDFL